jgi:hypothetical protein
VDDRMELLAFNPHYRGPGRMRVRAESVRRDRHSPLQGSVFGSLVEAMRDEGVPLVVDAPDFDIVAEELQPPQVVTMQIAGFAHEIECFEDEVAFAAVERALAPRAFIPSGLFGVDADGARAEALLTGTVLQTSLLRNPDTGTAFQALVVETLGGTLDVVAPPESLLAPPARGWVIRGHFWLSGRLADG